MLTGSEVPDQKSVIRFLLTMSLSALPRSSLEEERPRALETQEDWDTWMGALALSEPEHEEFYTNSRTLRLLSGYCEQYS